MFAANGGAVSDDKLYVEDVFSTYLYTGSGSPQTISNGVKLNNSTSSWSTDKITDQLSNRIDGVAVDASNNYYIVGSTQVSGGQYTYVAKLDSSGTVLWQRKYSKNSDSVVATDLVLDSSGNVYVCGYTNVSSGRPSGYVIKYNNSGVLQWHTNLYSGDRTYAAGVAVDSSGNVYVTGQAYDVSRADDIAFVSKLNSTGALQWSYKYTDLYTTNSLGISADSSGNVYIVGYQVSRGAFLLKLDTGGNISWQKRLSSGFYNLSCVRVDSSNNVYVAGNISSALYLLKFDSSGTNLWQRQVVSYPPNDCALAIDSSGNIYVSGSVTDKVSLICKYNSSGNILWKKSVWGSLSDYTAITSLATNSSGKLLVAGWESTYGYVAWLDQNGSTSAGSAFINLSSIASTDSAGAESIISGSYTTGSLVYLQTPSSTDDVGSFTKSTATQAEVVGSGGMVWIKGRSGATDHALYDTYRGAGLDLASNTAVAQTTESSGLFGFNLNGFGIGPLSKINTNNSTYASWTFRKAPKFFDVVTYTGNGVAGREINHNLNAYPGMIIIKRTDTTSNWPVWHIGHGVPASIWTQRYATFLNQTGAQVRDASYWNDTYPSDTTFTVGNNADVNASGGTYVAYVFSMSGRGGFGDSGTDSIISCGSYAGNGSTTGPEINLGWEPQYVLIKCITNSYSWIVVDVMRGMAQISYNALELNNSNAEYGSTSLPTVIPTSTGFKLGTAGAALNGNGQEYIYMAIRRGPMRTPTDGTKVFMPVVYSGTGGANVTQTTGFPVDFTFNLPRNNNYEKNVFDRLRGWPNGLYTNLTVAEFNNTSYLAFDSNTGVYAKLGSAYPNVTNGSGWTYVTEAFRRAPGFFDVVCYTGTGAARTVNHNLGVAPELMIVKMRSQPGPHWNVWHNSLPVTTRMILNATESGTWGANNTTVWNSTLPTKSVFSVGTFNETNNAGDTFVAYLFASCPGVSKVGSYTGNGTSQTINCGFSSGARFVLIKRTDSTGDWYIWDTARGIITTNDPHLSLNTTAAEVTTDDTIDPDSTGFIVNQVAATNVNVNAATYIYLAIA